MTRFEMVLLMEYQNQPHFISSTMVIFWYHMHHYLLSNPILCCSTTWESQALSCSILNLVNKYGVMSIF